MKKFYTYLSATLLTLASLSSCSRSDYAFKPATSAYHGTELARKTTPAPAETVTPVATPEAVVAATPTAKSATKQLTVPAAKKTASVAPAAKKTALQQKLVAKVTKRLASRQETASANQTQSKAGKAAIVTLVGLLLLLLGVAGVPIVGLIGLIALIVGVILLVIALVNS